MCIRDRDGTCSAEFRIRIASAMAAIARLNRICRGNTISFANMLTLYKSLVTSILIYGCETWTLLSDSESAQGNFSIIRAQDQRQGAEQDPREPLLTTTGRRKLAWFGHVTRQSSHSRTILQGNFESGRRRGWLGKCWMGNIKEWT